MYVLLRYTLFVFNKLLQNALQDEHMPSLWSIEMWLKGN